MVWFFLDPLWNGSGSLLQWIGNTIFGLAYIWLYLYSFSHPEPKRLYATMAMLFMASVLIPTHNGAVSALLIYAIAAGAFTTNRARVVSLIGIALGLLGFYSYQHHLPPPAWGSMGLLLILVGVGNHIGAIAHCAGEKLRKADEEIEHLAKVAERGASHATCMTFWDILCR